jgi:hypothetical protein
MSQLQNFESKHHEDLMKQYFDEDIQVDKTKYLIEQRISIPWSYLPSC